MNKELSSLATIDSTEKESANSQTEVNKIGRTAIELADLDIPDNIILGEN